MSFAAEIIEDGDIVLVVAPANNKSLKSSPPQDDKMPTIVVEEQQPTSKKYADVPNEKKAHMCASVSNMFWCLYITCLFYGD